MQTPFFTRNPYLFSDPTWGVIYVRHGVAGVALVGLVIAHVYFAVRPEKWWITKSMMFGWITRRQYLEHHDPQRVAAPPRARDDGSSMLNGSAGDAIEEGYEFMLAYAAQGLAEDAGASRRRRFAQFLAARTRRSPGSATSSGLLVEQRAPGRPIAMPLHRRPRSRRPGAQAAVQLVLAQPGISSQLVDNLNASIHLRALLTDLFLIDEILKGRIRTQSTA